MKHEAEIRRALRARDADAMVRACEGVVILVARRYTVEGYDRDDLRQLARIGIAQAVDTYRGPCAARPFVSFAALLAERRIIDRLHASSYERRRANVEAIRLDAPANYAEDADSVAEFHLRSSPSACDVLLDREAVLDVLRRFERLSPVEREAALRLLRGEPYLDSGTAADAVAYKRMDNATQRARAKLAA